MHVRGNRNTRIPKRWKAIIDVARDEGFHVVHCLARGKGIFTPLPPKPHCEPLSFFWIPAPPSIHPFDCKVSPVQKAIDCKQSRKCPFTGPPHLPFRSSATLSAPNFYNFQPILLHIISTHLPRMELGCSIH